MAMSEESFPLWFPVFFVTLWLFVGALLSELSRWPALARAYPDDPKARGERLRGQVTAVGWVNENNVTTIEVTPVGLRLRAIILFRFRRPPLLVPWEHIRGAEVRRFLWARWYVLDLGGITTVSVKARSLEAVRPYLTGPAGSDASRFTAKA
jgi:hypothetical protein